MPRSTPSRVAPGVDRLGDDVVNFYLVEEADGLVLVDAGLPAHLGQLREHLAAAGRSPADIRAVLLTHGHPDHTGLARTLQQAGADIWVHEQDAAILRDGPRSALRHAKPERSMLRYLLRRPAARSPPRCTSPGRAPSPPPPFPAYGSSTPTGGWTRSPAARRPSPCPATPRAAPATCSPNADCSSPETPWSPTTA